MVRVYEQLHFCAKGVHQLLRCVRVENGSNNDVKDRDKLLRADHINMLAPYCCHFLRNVLHSNLLSISDKKGTVFPNSLIVVRF